MLPTKYSQNIHISSVNLCDIPLNFEPITEHFTMGEIFRFPLLACVMLMLIGWIQKESPF